MRSLLLGLLLLTAAMAGCTGSDDAEPTATILDDEAPDAGNTTQDDPVDDGGTDASDDEAETGDNESADNSEEATPNTPPSATLSASVQEGTAPIEISFTLDGSDADGDNLTWSFDPDEDGAFEAEGTELPATVNFTYASEGAFNATMAVTDGMNATMQTVTIQVSAAAPTSFEPVSFSQDVALSCPHCASSDVSSMSGCIGFQAGQNGVDCAFFDLDLAWEGRSWTASGSLLPVVQFHPDCSTADIVGENLDAAGTIPAGAGCVTVFDLINPVVTLVFAIE